MVLFGSCTLFWCCCGAVCRSRQTLRWAFAACAGRQASDSATIGSCAQHTQLQCCCWQRFPQLVFREHVLAGVHALIMLIKRSCMLPPASQGPCRVDSWKAVHALETAASMLSLWLVAASICMQAAVSGVQLARGATRWVAVFYRGDVQLSCGALHVGRRIFIAEWEEVDPATFTFCCVVLTLTAVAAQRPHCRLHGSSACMPCMPCMRAC